MGNGLTSSDKKKKNESEVSRVEKQNRCIFGLIIGQ